MAYKFLTIPFGKTHVTISTASKVEILGGQLMPAAIGCKHARPDDRMPILWVALPPMCGLWVAFSLN